MQSKTNLRRGPALRRGLVPGALAALVLAAAAMASPAADPVNVDPPTITGTARQGEALTAQNGPGTTVQRSSGTGGCAAISWATRASCSPPTARPTGLDRPMSVTPCVCE